MQFLSLLCFKQGGWLYAAGGKKSQTNILQSYNVFFVSRSLRVEWRPRSPECTATHSQAEFAETAFKSCNNEL